ncbi:MAG: Mrp/NBP35 family ATP-binding protein [Pseudomonadota bacterium]
MTATKQDVLENLARLELPDGGNLVSRDFVRAVTIDGAAVKFVIEAPTPEIAERLGAIRQAAEQLVLDIDGIETVSAVVTAHAQKAPPNLKVGRHPTAQDAPLAIPGVDRIVVIGSGKGGVGKSTVSSNLAVALAQQGRKVGLLDADIYGPSQPRMMGVSGRPSSPDGKQINPLTAHGVTIMSIGLMVDPDKAVVWRGPMLMGALQQMLQQVNWGELDVLLVDLPPGTGDVQLTLCQKALLTGAIVVSTPQDVALIDARKAIDMFHTLHTPILGMIENMSHFVCPHCGQGSEIFGSGGVAAEASKLGVPLLAQLPIELDVRLAGDSGTPAAAKAGAAKDQFAALAQTLIQSGFA